MVPTQSGELPPMQRQRTIESSRGLDNVDREVAFASCARVYGVHQDVGIERETFSAHAVRRASSVVGLKNFQVSRGLISGTPEWPAPVPASAYERRASRPMAQFLPQACRS